MGKEKFHPFRELLGAGRKGKVLGWQYEMIYLGGDPYNPEQAVVNVRALEKAVVIRSVDGKEESFHSVLIPYSSIRDIRLVDEETGHVVPTGEKGSLRDVFEKVLLEYEDNGTSHTLELRMSMAADIYQNSRLCKNMQKYVASKLKKAGQSQSIEKSKETGR